MPTNKLINETSPYLLQHAHNPVDWYPWGEEALEKARTEDKPILVSIGYAACHWCHVMEHESFEDDTTAELMNKYFINIKVDREERPDLDNIYMNACQILTGAGGWPLNVFLTPELKPFNAGTYFPPKPGYGKPSWKELLMYMYQVYADDRDKVEHQANLIMEHIAKMDGAFLEKNFVLESENIFSKQQLDAAINTIQSNFDRVDGGFGSAPKFPATMTLRFLLRYAWFTNNKPILDHVILSLNKMHQGGIFDQIGGGFARYATDNKWMIPHFEKMLYDNALLCSLYAEAYRATGDNNYLQVVKDIIQYIDRECSDELGGLYAAYDADSEGVEGLYYTFTYQDLENALGDDAVWAAKVFNATSAGNWEHTNILHRDASDETTARQLDMTHEAFSAKLKLVKGKLLQYREKRIKPALDNKILLSWNALMCSAFVDAYKASGEEQFRQKAIQLVQHLTSAFKRKNTENAYWHVITNNIAKQTAFLDDYATLIQALFDVFEITGDEAWFKQADGCMEYVIANFSATDGMFFFTEKSQTDLPSRNAEYYDNATPSGNSIMLSNFQRRSITLENTKDVERVRTMLGAMKNSLIKYPTSFGNWWLSALKQIYPSVEIAVTGPDHQVMRDRIFTHYHPHILVQNGNNAVSEFPLLQHRASDVETRIFVCHNFTCKKPVTTLQDFVSEVQTLG